jgi:hypothetical protein
METLQNIFCDVNGSKLSNGSIVQLIDTDSLTDCDELKVGAILVVTDCIDLESNYLQFSRQCMHYEFFGFRVLNITN